MKKFFITTTIPRSLNFFKGNLKYLNEWFEVCAISSQSEELKEFGNREGVRTYCISMVRSISLLKDIICLFKFIFLFVRERPYIVHGNTPKASMLSMVAAWVTRVPVRIYMCHGLRYQGTQGVFRKLLILMEKLTCACSTEVICVSNGVRNTFFEDGICGLNKSVVLGYGSATGLDLQYFDPNQIDENQMRKELGIPKEDFIFIFVGRIVEDKGINELVAAFDWLSCENEHVHLVLVGNEELNLNPISLESRKTIEMNKHIYAIGRRNDIRPYLVGSDAFVFPSYREGFGMVLIEANAMGIPAISSNIIGCNEIIIKGENGDIIPPKNTNVLYDKMKEWASNPQKLKAMGTRARLLVEQRFDRTVVWKNALNEYLRLVDSYKN